jgi:hypothetical protein
LGATLLVHERPDRFESHVGIDSRGYHREWLECNACGSATNRQDAGNERKLASLAAGYYEVDFANSSIAEKYAKVMALPVGESDNAGRVERIRNTLRVFQGRFPSGSAGRRRAVLDIGAGTGVFLSLFLDLAAAHGEDWRAIGVEPDPNAVDHLLSLRQFEVHAGPYTGQMELRGVDLVTLNKVVEHIPDPVPFIDLAGRALSAETGILYVEVPDVLTIGRRAPNDNVLGALHHHLYTPQGVMALFQRAGLVSLDVGRIMEPSGKITVYGFAAMASAVDAFCGVMS